ncbi:hypothetical protein R1flu_025988 [Riccia fluitans]|uniref:Uncharacterized protein n=1 Tax=Riccia fluitans TaxID=41844 RepID=A0ABD1XEP0_9MARC
MSRPSRSKDDITSERPKRKLRPRAQTEAQGNVVLVATKSVDASVKGAPVDGSSLPETLEEATRGGKQRQTLSDSKEPVSLPVLVPRRSQRLLQASLTSDVQKETPNDPQSPARNNVSPPSASNPPEARSQGSSDRQIPLLNCLTQLVQEGSTIVRKHVKVDSFREHHTELKAFRIGLKRLLDEVDRGLQINALRENKVGKQQADEKNASHSVAAAEQKTISKQADGLKQALDRAQIGCSNVEFKVANTVPEKATSQMKEEVTRETAYVLEDRFLFSNGKAVAILRMEDLHRSKEETKPQTSKRELRKRKAKA